MNIYLIDDDKQKIAFLQPILERLRARTPLGGLSFEDGFGRTHNDIYLDSNALMNAVSDPEGICLIDMKFPDEALIVVEELTKILHANAADKEILISFENMQRTVTEPFYHLGLLLVAICKQRNTKFFTISTGGMKAVCDALEKWGIKVTPFPFTANDDDNSKTIDKVVSDILAQFDFVEDLKTRTLHWFKDESLTSHQLWHTWHPAHLIQHQSLIHQTWSWFPERWWSTDESAQNLHENLKHLCGSTACWIGGNSEPRSLSVGAAYLLALMIMEHRFPGWTQQSPETLVPSFQGFNRATLRWLPEQDRDLAEKILRAYVDVLLAVGVLKNTDQPGIRKIIFDKPGRRMQLVLAWGDEDVEKLAQRTKNLFAGKAELTVSLGRVSKTLANLQRLHALTQINSKGFGAPGYFYIEENTLHVGS